MLRVWLPLNGDLHNQGLSSYNSTSTNYTVINQGKIGKCIKCTNSINTGIPANGWDFTTTSISFGAWIKINKAELETKTSAATYSSIYTSCGGTLLGNHNYGGFGLRWATNNIQSSGSLTDVYIYANMRNKNRDTVKTSNYTVPFDTWTHVIVIFNREKGTLSLYINGTLFQTESSPIVTYGTTGNISQGDFYICQASWDSGKGNTMAGPWQLNDVRIYDHALSAKEVEEIAKGLVLHYPLNNNGLGNENLINNSMFSNLSTSGNVIKDTTKLFNGMSTCKISKTGATSNTYLGWTSQNLVSQLTPGEKITVSVWVYRESNHGIDAGCEWRMYQEYKDNGTRKTDWTGFYNSSSWTIGQWVRFSHTYTIRENITGVYFNLDVIKNGTYWIAQPKVERGSLVTNWCPSSSELNLPTNIIYDSSGYNNNGTIVGSLETTTPSPRYSCATKFNGSSYIKKTDFIYNSNIWSVSLWYLKPTNPTAYECLFCFSQGDGGDSNKKIAAIPNSGYIWYKGESSSSSISQLKINEWTNLIMTCNGTTVTIYQNGNPIGTFSASTALTGRTDLVIGARASAENATNIAVPYTGNLSDFRIYATALTAEQVADLYHTSMAIDNQGNIHAREFGGIMSNIFISPSMGIASKIWTTGLSNYTQANCQVTLTNKGLRIYRPPNKTPSADGNTMWGGMRLVNATTTSLSHTYDPAIDNFFGLIQGHTYIIRFHVSGQSSNSFATFEWTNQMGWGGGGLQPTPSNIEKHGIPANFNGEEECFYKFTINDTISKTCTSTYSYATKGNPYLSYTHFGVGFTYANTGALGTDIYISNLRMYDITTGINYSINKKGQLLPEEIIEQGNIASIQKGGSILCDNFYEY